MQVLPSAATYGKPTIGISNSIHECPCDLDLSYMQVKGFLYDNHYSPNSIHNMLSESKDKAVADPEFS